MGVHGGTKRPQEQAVAACFTIWNDSKKDFAKAASLNGAGRSFASSKIASGDVNKSASWSFSAQDGNALLGPNGTDWTNYSRHHLGMDSSAPDQTKARYKYPFAKAGTVYRSGLIAVRQRAAQQGDDAVFAAAGSLISKIDGEGKMIEQRDVDSVQRAYAVLEVKSIQPEQRIIRGMATTPEPDRMGDVVEPLGVQFTNPLPLLWQHDTKQPIGTALFSEATKDGIKFEAHIADIAEPGKLKDRIDEAWQSIKAGLVRGVSIGFKAIEYAFMKETDGIHFLKTSVLEL